MNACEVGDLSHLPAVWSTISAPRRDPGVSAGMGWPAYVRAAPARESLGISACSRSDQFDLHVNLELRPRALGCDGAGGQTFGERQTRSVTER
jgi:hypothetical protein